MFTGIVQLYTKVVQVDPTEAGIRLVLDVGEGANAWKHAPVHGDSIAVNGCCLTVARVQCDKLHFDVIHQTLQTTTLGYLQVGEYVNLEHAATPSTLLGGHIVQGHIDGVGVFKTVEQRGGEYRVQVEPPRELMEFIVERGSIAVDGVSLTVASVLQGHFEVALIPTTLNSTTLGRLREGDKVNLEVDYLARLVVSWLERKGLSPSMT